MDNRRLIQQLDRFLHYALGRRPDEFGLTPDPEGYVKIKDILKVLGEEAGWKHVRRSHFNEIIMTLSAPAIEIRGDRIRAAAREFLPRPVQAEQPPKILFTCIRRRAHAFVVEKGVHPAHAPYIVLSADRDLALRMGKRTDQDPVTLTVQVGKSMAAGISFLQYGRDLFLADAVIPPDCFSAPPPPKQKTEMKPAKAPDEKAKAPTPGSFFIRSPHNDKEKKKMKREKKKRAVAKEKERRRNRNKKADLWSDM